MRKVFIFLAVSVLFSFFGAVQARAHGVNADYKTISGIEIEAVYDTGHPMAGGEAIVYAPDNPAKPWTTATLDDQGRFNFFPDHSLTGTWSVQVRQSGHGAMIHIPISDAGVEKAEPLSGNSLSKLQKLVIALSFVWGSIGTALFFSRSVTGINKALFR